MRTQTRFLTGGLASLAVASTLTLAAPAFADEQPSRPCGQPATAAVYVTVVREGVLVQVPAVTHDEWRWERTVTTFEHEYSRVVSPAYTETDWVRDLPGTTEYRWSHVVVDRAAVPAVSGTAEVGHWETVVVTPAVTTTLFEYEQQQTGKRRWEPDGWNGEKGDVDKGQGWFKTGSTRSEETTPAVTEQRWVVDQPATPGTPAVEELSHVEYTWSPASPGAGWDGPLDSRTTGGGTEHATTDDDQPPAGAGWVQVGPSRTVPAVVDTVWAVDAPDGYTPTGASRVRGTTVEQTATPSATAPEGDGWSPVTDSKVVVVDVEAHTETVGGSTEQVLVTPAQDATAPCPQVESAHTPSTSHVGAPKGSPSALVSGVEEAAHGAHSTTPVVDAPAATTSTVLPATGSPVSPLLLASGLGALLTGGVLVRAGRRRTS